MIETLFLIGFVYMMIHGIFGSWELTLMFGSTILVVLFLVEKLLTIWQKKIYAERKKEKNGYGKH